MAYAPDWRSQGPEELLSSKNEIIRYLTSSSSLSPHIQLTPDSSFSHIEEEARRLALAGRVDEREDDFILAMFLAAAGGVEAVAYFPIQVLDEERQRQTHFIDVCEIEALMKEWGRHLEVVQRD